MIKIPALKIQRCLAPENREVELAVLVTLFLPLKQAGKGRFWNVLRDVMCQNPSYGMMSLSETVIKMYLVFLPLYVYA